MCEVYISELNSKLLAGSFSVPRFGTNNYNDVTVMFDREFPDTDYSFIAHVENMVNRSTYISYLIVEKLTGGVKLRFWRDYGETTAIEATEWCYIATKR